GAQPLRHPRRRALPRLPLQPLPGRARRRDRPGCPGRGGRARLPMSAAEFGVDVTPGADGVAWLVLRNPARRNAVRLEMWQAIPDAVRSLTVDPNVRVLVMRGHGEEAFASGADISEFATHRRDAAAAAAYEETTARAFEALLAVEQPVVAMIHGACVGGGLALAACADLRIAADDARLALPAARLGLGYHFSGVERLVRLVGPSAAAELFFTARPYTAAEVRRPFGWTGVPVPVIGQGTWNLERADRAEAVAALRRGLDAGMTHVDTAEMYGAGRVEELVGEAIAGRRDEVFLVSKVLPEHASFAGVLAACEASLRRLATDRLDLYLLHWASRHPLEQTIAGFERLVRDGKIRHYGVSNFDTGELERALALAGPDRIACNQVLYHREERAIEHAVLPWCERHGMAV